MTETGMTVSWIDVRDATDTALDGILEIHNHYVLTTNALPQREARSIEQHRSWYDDLRNSHFPLLVSYNNLAMTGYAYIDRFSPPKSFDPAIESHIYVHPAYTGRGIGTVLLQALIQRARTLQRRTLIARIDSSNVASIHIHSKCGFIISGRLVDIGFKNGKFVSSTYMQLMFDNYVTFE